MFCCFYVEHHAYNLYEIKILIEYKCHSLFIIFLHQNKQRAACKDEESATGMFPLKTPFHFPPSCHLDTLRGWRLPPSDCWVDIYVIQSSLTSFPQICQNQLLLLFIAVIITIILLLFSYNVCLYRAFN